MKKLLQISALTIAVSAFAISPAPAQTKKTAANQPAAQSKISKADAERLVTQRNPGATVLNTVEATVKGQKVWAVSIVGTGGNVSRKAYVDEETGKISY